MAQTKVAYQDGKGRFHATPDQSTVADLSDLLGNGPIGRQVFELRADIERIFAEHDRMNYHTESEAGASEGLT